MTKIKVAVTGINGQVTQALQSLSDDTFEVIAIGRPELDLADPLTIEPALLAVKPDVIVSAAAYTAVDKAESESDLAFAINQTAPGFIAKAAKSLNVPIIHISTDYVFDGTGTRPYVESDATNPLSVYGASKLGGEKAVAEQTDNHVILRTAWVYSATGNNFLKTMLRLAASRPEVSVVSDQFGAPTSADDIASAVKTIAYQLVEQNDARLRGIFHLSGTGYASWADFAEHIFKVNRDLTGTTTALKRISSDEFVTPVKRPANSRLDCAKLNDIYGIQIPNWQQSATKTIGQLTKEGQ